MWQDVIILQVPKVVGALCVLKRSSTKTTSVIFVILAVTDVEKKLYSVFLVFILNEAHSRHTK